MYQAGRGGRITLRHSVNSLIFMRPLVLLFLAVGTSHGDAVNVKRESFYSITLLIHEIGGLGVTVRTDARFATSASVFVQIMKATPHSLSQRSFTTKGAGQLERISS